MSTLPCDRFEDNGSLGCQSCGWNLAAHSRADQVRMLGEEVVAAAEEDDREVEP